MNLLLKLESDLVWSAGMNHLLKLESDLNDLQAERDLYKARYECLKNLCGIGKQDSVENWCALRGRDSVVVEKNCETVDEAVDFLLGGNGNE